MTSGKKIIVDVGKNGEIKRSRKKYDAKKIIIPEEDLEIKYKIELDDLYIEGKILATYSDVEEESLIESRTPFKKTDRNKMEFDYKSFESKIGKLLSSKLKKYGNDYEQCIEKEASMLLRKYGFSGIELYVEEVKKEYKKKEKPKKRDIRKEEEKIEVKEVLTVEDAADLVAEEEKKIEDVLAIEDTADSIAEDYAIFDNGPNSYKIYLEKKEEVWEFFNALKEIFNALKEKYPEEFSNTLKNFQIPEEFSKAFGGN